ncbi:replication protein P [Endozoicomonas sp. GU-1]|uniref:replication protein P n=1 Tax=Endozoicomonas sp. GU-1 TaxID=3009078 RepID=UPI0022B30E8E|nr:replication protein P [Endozoicomonas sp. GU-1]WBA79579.1 replication protein P [Endozoicomonas sp. GU-1]
MSIQTMPQLIKQVTSISSTKESFNSGADNELMKQVLNDRVNQVFGAIRAAVPAHFESMYGDTTKLSGEQGRRELERKRQARITAKRLWMMTPEFQSLRADQVERAIVAIQLNCRFVPTMAEFLELASDKPEDFGLPSPDDAWLEANKRRQAVMEGVKVNWSHPVIALAGRGLWHQMGMADEIGMKKVRADFDKAYRRESSRVISGNDAGSELLKIEDRSGYADKQLLQAKFDIERQMEKQGIAADPEAARARLRGLF